MRIDSPLLLASIAPVLAVLHASASRPQRWATHAFLPLAIVLAGWGAVHAWMFSRAYVQGLGSALVPLWALTLAVVALSVAAIGLSRHTGPGSCRLGCADQGTLLWGVAAITLCAAFFAGMWVRPRIEPFQINPNSGDRTYYEETLVRMAWYVSMPGLVLALGGVLTVHAAMGGAPWRRVAPFLAILLPFALLYFWRPSIHPDHPWAMRRFLPGDPSGHLRGHSRRCRLPVDSGSMVAVRPRRRNRQCRSGDVARGHDQRPVLAVPREERCHQPAWGSCGIAFLDTVFSCSTLQGWRH